MCLLGILKILLSLTGQTLQECYTVSFYGLARQRCSEICVVFGSL